MRGITEAVATESIYFTGCRPKVEIKAEFQGVNGQRSIPNAVATPGCIYWLQANSNDDDGILECELAEKYSKI